MGELGGEGERHRGGGNHCFKPSLSVMLVGMAFDGWNGILAFFFIGEKYDRVQGSR